MFNRHNNKQVSIEVVAKLVSSPDPTLKRREKGLVTLGYFVGLAGSGSARWYGCAWAKFGSDWPVVL